ncbi:sodium/pantothenate symporter [Caldalkalibacillus thermarum TA2.A1]|uniref:Sodium/pantothenate symporter n=1 Tax=Caldalkalibacillus thermarum (strain TA2.A1) TaxID=986075 RepID=F5L493_CALTT|nr:sodium/pantothenate symporter [Caldalkalibacillus thermarum]EGL83834.1 sodium/pantothenate symporter [Caldalkalibacillus thermarum TA2.A1]QZT32490.1 sodium/pantothenate symporter [Caldalkalibacillus thermarum TA2.A1]
MKWDVLLPIFIYLFATFIIGIYLHKYLKKRKTDFQEEFFVGGRSLGPIVLAFTMLASAASVGTFIGSPGMAYNVGFSWALVTMTQVFMGVYILGILGKKFAIVARKINAVTLTDFLRERYKSHAVVIGSALGIIIFIGAYMVAQFVGGARILEAITGLPYHVGLLIFGLTVVLYTAIGGFRAVAVTDAIQGIMMIVGGVLLWIMFMLKTDGFSVLMSELAVKHPEMLTLPSEANITPLMLFSYFFLLGIACIGLPHASVRGMIYKDADSMHRAIIYSGIIMGLFSIGFVTLGPVTKVLYPEMEVADMALPILILDIMPGWIAGLILAAPLAAIMSTVDSMLLVTSSSIVKDLYLNYINPDASDKKIAKLTYMTTLVIGVGVVLFSLTPPEYVQLIVLYAIGGLEATFFAPIVLGLYWKRATGWGAIASMYSGLISYLVIANWFPNPFGMHTIVTALTISIVAMVIVSLATPKPSFDIIQKFWGKEGVSDKTIAS